MNDPIDLVYVFRNTGKECDTELFYSLRSVKKHVKNVRRIIIVGDLPKFPQKCGVEFDHWQCSDRTTFSLHNIRAKLQRVLATDGLSGHFLLFNDDFFVTRPFDAWELPFYKSGSLEGHIDWRSEQEGNPYLHALRSTRADLVRNNLPTRDFEVHVPIRFEKHALKHVLSDSQFDWGATQGLNFRSLYCNLLKLEGQRYFDIKLDRPMSDSELDHAFTTHPFVSTGVGALNTGMLFKLEELYPLS